MKKWIVRVVSLYAFNVVVLLLLGLLMPNVRVGWAAFGAAVVLTAATLALKPLLLRVFRGAAARSASDRTRAGEKTVQYVLVFLVELIVWVLTVWFSGVHVNGWFWGYVIPPIALLIAWVIYDVVDDRVENRARELYDVVQTKVAGGSRPASGSPDAGQAPGASAAQAQTTRAARDELNDGLTPEQRRMLDEL